MTTLKEKNDETTNMDYETDFLDENYIRFQFASLFASYSTCPFQLSTPRSFLDKQDDDHHHNLSSTSYSSVIYPISSGL